MKLYAPKYYKNFKCIADKCEHSCCVGWEIDIDSDTLTKYEGLCGDYAEALKKSISYGEVPHFKLLKDERCPHLDECGLCKIITNLGEEYLCDICRLHPRFYNYTDASELGIGMSCREAARIILSSPDYAVIEEIGDDGVEAIMLDFNGRHERGKIYELLAETETSYAERLDKIYRKYSIESLCDSYWLEILDSLEYLDESRKNCFSTYSSLNRPQGFDEYLERFFAYLVFRHTTEAEDAHDFRARLSFCLFCERLFASLICTENAKNFDELVRLASIISEEIEYSDENTEALTY